MAGAKPSFDESDVIIALFEIYKNRISRGSLTKKLGVGEGSVRTILGQLAKKGFISSTKAGHSITFKGQEEVKQYLKHFSFPKKLISNDMLSEKYRLYSILYQKADSISPTATQETIEAIKAGADSAVILINKTGKLVFPSGMDIKDYPQSLQELSQEKIQKNDVCLLISSNLSMQKALKASICMITAYHQK